MTFKPLILASASILLLASSADAQSPGQRIIFEQSNAAARQEGSVRVQSNVNFFVPGPTGDSEEAQKLREHSRRAVYEMAAHECDMLREILAKDCRMESINTTTGRQFGQQQPEGYTVNGAMSFQITLK